MTITGQARELRVGYVVKRFPRLSETFILNEILELERQGVDVEVFALRRPEKGVRHALTDQVRARVTYLPGASGIAGWTVRTKQPDWQLRKQQLPKLMAQEDLDLGPLFATPEPEVICKLHLQAATLAMLATGRRIDHLHAHFGTEATTVALLASRMSGIAYSYTAHARDIYHTYVDAETDDRQRRSKLAEARFVVTVSEYNRNYLRNLAGEPAVAERIQRLYNGIDLERFQPQPGARSPNMLLAVGRLIEKKGFSDLVDACATLRQRGTSFRCVIVGDGPLRTALQGQIDAAGLGGQVELRGAQAQNVVVGLMAEASAFVLPCVVAESGDRDGLPTVLLEALAMGVPIVSTSVAGIPEISADGECGLLVPPGEPQTLATAIATLLEDPAFADRLGRAGRLKAETAFDLRKNVAVLRNLFAAAADRPASHEGDEIHAHRVRHG